MQIGCFLDTNILIYAAAGKQDEPRKYAAAKRIIESELFGVSGQVLGEFYVNVLKRTAVPLTFLEVDSWIEFLCRFPFTAVDTVLVRQGIVYAQKFRISYWDAAIIAAAERLGAPILYTEDLNHEQHYGSVQVINPFMPD